MPISVALLKSASRLAVLALAVQSQAAPACDMPVPQAPSISTILGDPRYTVFVGTVIRTLPGAQHHSDSPAASVMRVDAWYGRGAAPRQVTVPHDPPSPPTPCGHNPYFVARTGEQWVIVGRYRGTVLEPDPWLSLETGGKGQPHPYSQELETFRLSSKNRR